LLQLVVTLALLVQVHERIDTAAWRWGLAAALAGLALAVLLLLRLPRDLQWRPRRSKRASREVLLERQRIARDLHDHVGSQLVGALAQLDPGDAGMQPLAQALEQCLLDLRLVVDSMDGDDDLLPWRLARVRRRVQPALDRQGIALQWQVSGAAGVDWPRGEAAREFTAIVQEAISNVLQHSGATEIAVLLQAHEDDSTVAPGAWRLQVSDNGRGLPQTHDAGGKGLANMRRRAARLGARLELLPPGHTADGEGAYGRSGLCVRVTVPASAG